MEYLVEETETDDLNLGGCLFYFAFAIDFVCLMRLMRSVLHLKRFNRTLFVHLQIFPLKFEFREVCSRCPRSHGQVPAEKGYLHMETLNLI